MNRSVIILGSITLALAALSGWLALELRDTRGQLNAARAVAVVDTPPSTPARLEAGKPAPAATNADTTSLASRQQAPSAEPGEDMQAQVRASFEQQLPHMRATLENPEKRAAFLRDVSGSLRRNFPRIGEHLGLTDDELDRLAHLLAEQQLRLMEMRYRCALNPNCDVMTFASGYRQTSDLELVDLLGAERKRRFDEYRHRS